MTLGTQNTLMSPAPRPRHRTLSATQKGWGEGRLLKDSYFLNPLNVLDLRRSPGICIFKTHPGDFLHTIRPGDQESTKGFQIAHRCQFGMGVRAGVEMGTCQTCLPLHSELFAFSPYTGYHLWIKTVSCSTILKTSQGSTEEAELQG